MEKSEKKGFLSGLKYAIYALFVLFAVICISFTISSKKNSKDGAISLFGHESMIVLSDSMGACEETDVSEFEIKSIPVKSMVFIELVPENEQEAYEWYSDIEVGDVLTFRYVFDRQVTITHRVNEIEPIEQNGTKGFIFTLVGDNKTSDSNPGVQVINTTKESSNYIIGKVTGQSKILGHVLTFLKSKIGIGIVIILPSLTLLIYEVINIVHILHENKKEKLDSINSELSETNKAQNEEIERLKKELEEMKKSQNKQ